MDFRNDSPTEFKSRPQALVVGSGDTVKSLIERLDDRGFKCVPAETGRAAIGIIDAIEDKGAFEVIFLSADLQAFELDWILAHLRAGHGSGASRVVIVGNSDSSKLKYWMSLGATSCIASNEAAIAVAARYWAGLA